MVTHLIALGPEFDLLPDDTEESLLGAPIHQYVIVALFTSLRRYARRLALPWFIGNQTTLVIPRAKGRPYQPAPDLMVHPTLGFVPDFSLNINVAGPPALVIEVASPSTARSHDLDTLRPEAKPGVYARTGIPEYLVYDPTGAMIPEWIRAWRMGPEGIYITWEPDERGHWVSRTLGVSFALDGPILAAYDSNGERIPSDADMDDLLLNREREAIEHAAEREREVAERDRQIAALQAELRRLRGE
jgi:Uma2 family endonuclease